MSRRSFFIQVMSGEDRSLNVDDGEEQEGDNEMQDEDGLEPSDLLDKKISDLQVAVSFVLYELLDFSGL